MLLIILSVVYVGWVENDGNFGGPTCFRLLSCFVRSIYIIVVKKGDIYIY